ncbi:MAG: hypothetical protein V3V99_11410 [candidate division Zixibacteria bacterium]
MRKFTSYKKLILLACLGLIVYWIGGCSERITNTNNAEYTAVSINTKIPSSKLSALVTHGLLAVNARDIDSTLVDTLEYIDGFMIGEIIVPAGSDRTFTIQVYDATNQPLYYGSAVTDILPDSAIELPIELRPFGSMLNFTPHYSEVVMGDSVIIDINLFNIPDLGSISIDLMVTQTGPMEIMYTTRGITLCDSCDVWHEGTAIGAWIRYDTSQVVWSLTDNVNGDAQLARSIFRTYADWQFDTATVKITAVIQSMYGNSDQGPIPVNSVYVDESEIFLIFPQ